MSIRIVEICYKCHRENTLFKEVINGLVRVTCTNCGESWTEEDERD